MEPTQKSPSQQEERAEEVLHSLGFPKVRVRRHGDVARVEIAREDLPRALSLVMLDIITAALRPCGFVYITLDIQGYRPGSINENSAVSVVAPAT
jgi:pyridinium-3,5-biscarboxylic acid mononucleotide sulfurtransferase